MTLWSKQLGEQCWAHLVYGAVETKLISSSVFVSSLCKALFSTLCGLEPSDVCNVFVEHFDHLILDYSTPHWFCICIFANPMKCFTRTGGRVEKEREGGKERGRVGERERKEERKE